jgi:hypothetical protein
MKEPVWNYSTINHGPRIALGLSLNEYAVFDYIYKTQTSPKYGNGGWCKTSLRKIESLLGLGKSTIERAIEKGKEEKLIITDGRKKKTTARWYENAYEWSGQIKEECPESGQSEPDNVPIRDNERPESGQKPPEMSRNGTRSKRELKKKGKGKEATTVLISENLKAWINKSFKKAELYELVKDTAITAPELIYRFANYWVNVEGRNFDARSIADRNGVKTSLQEFARVEAAQTPVEEQNVENSPVSDGLDEIYQAFAKYTVRGVSENAKKTTKPILRQMIISGTTIDQFDKTFSKIKKAAAKYRDFEYTIKHWDKLQAI